MTSNFVWAILGAVKCGSFDPYQPETLNKSKETTNVGVTDSSSP